MPYGIRKSTPSLLDLVKAELPLGFVGKWTCPLCPKAVNWRCDMSFEIDHGDGVTLEWLRALEGGFRWRVKQEIEQHMAEAHSASEA